jgi:hypothetical protein
MAEVIETAPPAEPTTTDARVFRGRTIAIRAAIVAVIGFIALAIGLAVDVERTCLSYLMAFAFVFTIAVGALIFLMTGYATNARWMSVVRRTTELVALPLPALAVLFLPIVFGAAWLYPWRSPSANLSAHDLEILQHRGSYLNLTFFTVRAVIYFAIFLIASFVLRRWSVRRDARIDALPPAGDEAANEAYLARDRKLASALLPPVGLAFTFAGFDWIMSLQPVWYSSILGFYLFAGGFLAAIAAVTLLSARLWHQEAGRGVVTPNHFHALGRLMFAFTVFWTYIAFFQAMLIRIANKPSEVTFYLERIEGGWKPFVYVLILGHFAVPFLILLMRPVKFRPRSMAAIAGWLLLMHLVDIYWLVIPSHVQGTMVLSWLDLAALAAVVGTAVAVAAWRQDGVLRVAEGDPFLAKGAMYRSKQL